MGPFTPREGHHAAYDEGSDVAIISFGKTFNTNGQGMVTLSDILVYDFSNPTDPWYLLPNSKGPQPRYGHYSFVDSGFYFIVGGVISPNIGYTDIWRYSFDEKAWEQLSNAGQLPNAYESAQVVHVLSSGTSPTKIYIFGGIALNTGSNVDNNLYCYDTGQQFWSLLNNNGISLYGAVPSYHKETNSIYFTGGYRYTGELRVQRYDIDSGYWYNIGMSPSSPGFYASPESSFSGHFQNPGDQRTFAKGIIVNDSIIVIGGQARGMTGVSVSANVCFSPYLQTFSISCQTWNQTFLHALEGRDNHAQILRNSSVWVFGGNNGGHLLNDIIEIPLPNLETKDAAETCQQRKWCSAAGSSYTCRDCKVKSYCKFCDSKCVHVSHKCTPALTCPSSTIKF